MQPATPRARSGARLPPTSHCCQHPTPKFKHKHPHQVALSADASGHHAREAARDATDGARGAISSAAHSVKEGVSAAAGKVCLVVVVARGLRVYARGSLRAAHSVKEGVSAAADKVCEHSVSRFVLQSCLRAPHPFGRSVPPAALPPQSPNPLHTAQVGATGRAIGGKIAGAGEDIEDKARNNMGVVYTGE